MTRGLFCIIALLFFSQTTFSQTLFNKDDDDDPYEHLSYFMYGLNYVSNNVYLGRKDSIVIPYYSPYVGYHFKNGLYAKGMMSFTSANGRHLDLTTIEIGYDRNFGEHFNGGINIDKYYFHKNSLSVWANTKGFASINGQYTNDWIEPQITFDANVNKNSTDYVTNITLDHDFKLADKKLHIIPAIATNIGTKHYYDEYFINRLTKKDNTLKIKKAVVDAGKYRPADYEFSIKTTYLLSKWLFMLISTYVIPVNPATVILPTRTVTEKLSNSFYIELDVCHR